MKRSFLFFSLLLAFTTNILAAKRLMPSQHMHNKNIDTCKWNFKVRMNTCPIGTKLSPFSDLYRNFNRHNYCYIPMRKDDRRFAFYISLCTNKNPVEYASPIYQCISKNGKKGHWVRRKSHLMELLCVK